MTKRGIVGTGVLLVVLSGGLFAVRHVHQRLRLILSRTALAARGVTPEAVAEPQAVLPPRAADFLQPRRLDSWKIIGPGGGGTFYYAAVSPHDPNLVFTTTDMTECYVSENGGHTWRSFNLRGPCRVVFDPMLPSRVYALVSGGQWCSDDRGHTWHLIYPGSETTVHYVDDEAEPYLQHPVQYGPFMSALAVDPDDSNTLYASIIERLQVSRDAGKTWKLLAEGAFAEQMWIDPTSPRDNRTVYTRRGTLIGTWDGTKYVTRPIPGTSNVYAAAFGTRSGGGKPVIYVASDYLVKDGRLEGGGIMATDDGGQTWRSLNDGILKLVTKGTYPNFSTIGASGKHAEVLYASFTHFNPPNDNKAYYGVMKTSDGGTTWTFVRRESSETAANMHNDWTSERWGPDWGDEPLSFGVSDTNPDLVYTTDLARVMRSIDGGKNWYGVNSQSTGVGYTTTGLDVTTCYGVHFDPFDLKRMFISYTDIGLMRSEDGGESWVSATAAGVPRAWANTTYWLEFDPAAKGKMWAAMSGHHDLPRYRELNHGGQGGVVMSVDGGHSWTVSNHGLPSSAQPTHILIDPKSPVSARVLYITAWAQGVYKSTDGGQNWALKDEGLPKDKPPLSWRMAMDSQGTLYVVTIRRSQDGKYGNADDGWLFRSRNGAESWERVPLPEGVNGPVSITVDPKDPQRLYVSAWARYTLYAAGVIAPDGGVYMSTDGGGHWQNVLNASRRIYDVTVDPRNSDLVYAVSFEASAWRSADRGKTWSRLGGFNFKDGHRAVPDPTDINKIYITTFGNSVWHGPAAGDPQAVEDITGPARMRFQWAGK